VGVTALLVLVVSGIAYAAVPGSNGVINGCYSKTTGALRVINTAKKQRCKAAKEIALSWSQQGQPGVAGAAGREGSAGKEGARGQEGPPGPYPSGPLPSGKTVRGLYAVTGSTPSAEEGLFSSISFGYEVRGPVSTIVIREGEHNRENEEHCPGSYEDPQANRGYLCVYRSVLEEDISTNAGSFLATSLENGTLTPGEPNRDGAFIVVLTKNGATSTNALGSWAVTAP